MTSFVLQLFELTNNGYFQLFLGFYVFVQVFWWLRVYLASKNKTYAQAFKGSYSVLVAVYHEDPKLFESCLKSITQHSKPTELVVAIDNAPNAPKQLKTLAKKYATTVIEGASRVGKRELYALAVASLKKKSDVIITVDSDTVWDESTINILKPFNDKRVGAASGRQTIIEADRTWVRRVAEWFEDLRFSVNMPFQSYFGQVNVIPGRTLAARRTAYTKAAEAARTETFLGRRMITSDDASVTMHILGQGYRVVYQQDSLVHTDAPSTIAGFFRQYVRWYRGAMRRFFHSFRHIMRMNPLVILANLEFLFFSFIYTGIVLMFAFKLGFRVYEFEGQLSADLLAMLVPLLIIGFFISAYIRNIPHFLNKKSDLLFLPVFTLFSAVVGLGIKITAAFSFSENGWLTRVKTAYGEGNVVRARTVAALTGLAIVVVTLPLSYLTDIRPYGVPFGVIIGQRGPEYYQAKQLSLQLTDSIVTNDPSDEQLIQLIHDNATHYKHAVTPELAHQAVPCVRASLQAEFTTSKLDTIDNCYQRTIAQETVPPTEVVNESPAAPTGIIVQAQPGDALTYLVRAQLKKQSSELNAAQAVFVETTYLAEMGQQSTRLNPGDTVMIDSTKLASLTAQAKALSAGQLAGWQYYANNIVW